ncbi:hypothetical protein [Hymenobacter metallicola]|uniref:Uncharacterized protein n=1 Tax=Hymenobacter metallicola TaxID=2563114 RepID=A0A4Z0QIK0_9BACT|nr:hypothetical protein [Hymenobacter metallicola]TGE29083.1 hypothetical protein E5K02_06405 [Hymenobacter metallicola]
MDSLTRVETWLEAGKQIGKSAPVKENGNIVWWSVGVQKWQGIYKLYTDSFIESKPLDYDSDSEEIVEAADFETLSNLVSSKSPFKIEELAPLKGQKIFNPRF